MFESVAETETCIDWTSFDYIQLEQSENDNHTCKNQFKVARYES